MCPKIRRNMSYLSVFAVGDELTYFHFCISLCSTKIPFCQQIVKSGLLVQPKKNTSASKKQLNESYSIRRKNLLFVYSKYLFSLNITS